MNAPATAVAGRPGPITMEDALGILQAKVAEKEGQDSFRVKVQRQAGFGAPLQHIASFANATIEHLANPETWLVMLAGGGPLFVLTATHANDTIPTVTFRPPTLAGEPRAVDPQITQKPDWRGPPDLTFPTAGDKPPVPSATPADVQGLFRMLGAPGSADPAARGPGTQLPGGSGLSSEDQRFALLEMQRRQDAERFERLIADQSKTTERALASMTQTMTEAVRSVAASIQTRGPEKSLVEQIAALSPVIVAVGGILAPLVTKSREMSAEQQKRDAEDRRLREEREIAARKEMFDLLRTTAERSAASSQDTMKVITPMVDAVAQMGRTVLQQVATMRDLTSGEPQDEGLTGLIKAGVSAVAEVMAARAANPPMPAPRQLPPGTGAPPAPQQPPTNEEAEGRAELRDMNPEELLTEVTEAIKAHHDVNKLVEGFLDAAQWNVGVATAVREAGGPLDFFRKRLGDEWIGQNANYISQVVSTLTIAAKKRGLAK